MADRCTKKGLARQTLLPSLVPSYLNIAQFFSSWTRPPQIVAQIPGFHRRRPLYTNVIRIYWDNKCPAATQQGRVRRVNDGIDVEGCAERSLVFGRSGVYTI